MNIPPVAAMRISVDALRSLVSSLFRKVGVPDHDADLITDLLIDTDLRGVLSHGTSTTAGYIRGYLNGSLNTTPDVQVVRDDIATAVVDGDGGLGHPASFKAAELAIEKASHTGIAGVVSRNHGHFGSAGKYTRMAVRRDFLGFCVSGHVIGEAGGRPDTPQFNPLGNPPMSFAIPSGTETPLILDMGTSFFEPDDFKDLFDRIPAAFFKSLGLVGTALIMGGAMAGMMSQEFLKDNRAYAGAGYGAFICAIDINRFAPIEDFKTEMDRSMQYIQSLPPMPGQPRYDFPGGPERDRESTWASEGIPLGETHKQSLEAMAHELGVPIPWRV